MSKKILYLGDDKWCYTENCKRHSSGIALQTQYKEAVNSGDIVSSDEIAAIMMQNPETKEALLRMRVQEVRASLGRAPVIGLDFDGTVADFTHGLREHLGIKYSIPREEWEKLYPDPDQYDYFSASTPWFNSLDEFLEEFFEAEKNGLYTKLPLIGSPNPALKRLRGYGFRILGTTARTDIYNADTLKWLRSRRISVERVIHTGSRKSHIKDADLFIDDSPKVLDELFENNRPAAVMTQDYNKDMELPSNLSRRLHGWDKNTTPQEVVDLAFGTTVRKNK